MKLCKTVSALQRALRPYREGQQRIALVPTMGALHAGHLELVRRARRRADVVVVSIFVNPLQFGPNEDFESYPRQLKRDVEQLEEMGVTLLFTPSAEQFYGDDHQTMILNSEVQSLYCGAFRPGHFSGVLTVIGKLFHVVMPHEAFFGSKDYQQAWLIEKMVADLNWPVDIRRVATVRASDGLALSSRNAYLSSEERTRAPGLYSSLLKLQQKVAQGERSSAKLLSKAKKEIEKSGGRVQYLQIASQTSLLPVKRIEAPVVVLAAVFYGKTRLIDNLEIFPPR